MTYSNLELKAFRIFYLKFPCLNCKECLEEADYVLQEIKHHFSKSDMALLLSERARGQVLGRSNLKNLIRTIYMRMGVPLEGISD